MNFLVLLLLLLLLLLLTLSFFITFLLTMQRKPRRRPPGPKGLPFIGNLLQIDPSKPHVSFAHLSKNYGPLLRLKFFRLPVIVISSADVAKKALKNNDLAFAGRPSTSTSLRLSYGHRDIFTAPYSDYCKRMRKMVVNNLFSPHKLRSFRPVRDEEVSRMIAEISDKAKNSDRPINVGETTSSFSCNVLFRLAFGKKSDQGTESWRRFDKIVRKFSASLFRNFFADCLLYGWVNKVNGAAGRVEKIFEDMDTFYQELIDEHLSPERPEFMNGDILDLLIQLREDESAPVKIDWKHIKAILMNLFIAGIESSGGTLLWALTSLMKNPTKMEILQLEITSIVGKKGSINEEDIEKLPYLKAVLKETMRLYPLVPLIPKETIHPCIINGYQIEAKTFVLVNTWAIGRDPEYWENPNEFLPERFLNTSIDVKGQDFGLIQFGSGRRICPGLPLAISTMEVALANLVYFFNWELPRGISKDHVDTATTVGLGLQKKNPLWLMPKTCM